MRPEWISDQPFHDLLPYVRMLGDQTVLLCNPPGLSPRGISRGFALGAMWRIGQLNCDALAWGAIHDALSALLPPLRDLPPLAIFEVRMTLRPTQSDPAWVAARQVLAVCESG